MTQLTTQKTIAIFDIGSNAVRLTIYRVQDRRPPVIIGKSVELCQLGRAHGGGNILYPEGRAKAMEVIAKYCQMIRAPQYGCSGYVAVATEAIRRADDGAEFVETIREKLGLNVRILGSEEEGLYGARGVLSGLPDAAGLVADLGGGSLQLTRIADGAAFETTSMPIGTLCLLGAAAGYQNLITQAAAAIPPPLAQAERVYIIGGSWRSFAKLYLARAGKDPREVQGIHLDPDKIHAVATWLLEGGEKTRDILQSDYHMEYGRAESMPQSAFLLTYLIDLLGAREVVVSAAGLRDGVLQAALTDTITLDSLPQG